MLIFICSFNFLFCFLNDGGSDNNNNNNNSNSNNNNKENKAITIKHKRLAQGTYLMRLLSIAKFERNPAPWD